MHKKHSKLLIMLQGGEYTFLIQYYIHPNYPLECRELVNDCRGRYSWELIITVGRNSVIKHT